MNNKTIFQIVLVLILLGGTIYFVERNYKPGPIEIVCDIHALREPRHSKKHRPEPNQPTLDVAFGLDQRYELTSVEVVPLDEWTTNKEALPLWHLVSETNSAPTKAFFYGRPIRGMRVAVKGARPEPLQANVVYYLIVRAGSREGECNFELPALPTMAP